MKPLLDTEELKELGRPIGDVRENKLQAYLNEVEQTIVKPAIGDALFLALHNEDIEPESDHDILLNGGEWTGAACGCADDGVHFFAGLKTAISYFVYAKLLMTGDIESTRYGFVQKEGAYSQSISQQQRVAAYNDAMEVGNAHLRDCVTYCKAHGMLGTRQRGASVAGMTIRKIG